MSEPHFDLEVFGSWPGIEVGMRAVANGVDYVVVSVSADLFRLAAVPYGPKQQAVASARRLSSRCTICNAINAPDARRCTMCRGRTR